VAADRRRLVRRQQARVALAQIMRLAGVSVDNCFLDQLAPKTKRDKELLGET
jgi:hypothetical protein